MHRPRVLIVDDEPPIQEAMRTALGRGGYRVRCAGDLREARRSLREGLPDLVFLDVRLPGEGGIRLLEEIRELDPNLPVVMITGFATIESAVAATKLGAYDYVEKPFRLQQIERLTEEALRIQELRKGRSRSGDAAPRLVGDSPVFRKVLRLVARVARTPCTTVLVLGESGTGKELVARAIHQASDRSGEAFIALNCAAISEPLLEAELFGYERGAFTGALREGKRGLFEAARGGTLFLDEIGEMPVTLQAKLLRVLQERSFKRVGGLEDLAVDARVIASTNRDLEAAIARGEFREDLYYRLSVMPIRLPALRERRDDLPLLARHFLETFNREHNRCIQGFSKQAMQRLLEHDWPGSVRELRNTVERAVIQTPGTIIQASHLGLARAPEAPPRAEWVLSLGDPTLRSAERALIRQVLERARWNISRGARMLGINRSTLYHKLRDYEIRQPADA